MILPDVLAQDLKVVFCGTAVSTASAKRRAYYAGPGNRFWPTLHRIKLTPYQFEPREYPKVLEYGVGLTDIAKTVAGEDVDLTTTDFDGDLLRSKIERFGPKVLAFNGKRAAKEFFGTNTVAYGRQEAMISDTVIFVLPSTSGAARTFWDETIWFELTGFLKQLDN